MNIDSKSLIKIVFVITTLFVVAFLINFIFFLLLPKQTVEYYEQKSYRYPYRNYDLLSLFSKHDIKKVKSKKQNTSYSLLSQIKLNAVYAKAQGLGWVVIQEKGNQKTHVLALEDTFKGYKLKNVYKEYALFEKNKKRYKVIMKNEKLKYNSLKKEIPHTKKKR